MGKWSMSLPVDRCLARRRAFTLMELILVLAIMAAIGGLAWPVISGAYSAVKLKKAAEQVQTALARARVEAMSSGLPQVFRFEPNSPRYTITVVQDETASLDSTANDTSSSSAGQNSNTPAGASGAMMPNGGQSADNPCEHQLPDGFIFTSAQRSSDTRSAVVEGQLSDTS